MIKREGIEQGRSRHSQDKNPEVARTDGGKQRNAWLRIAGAQSDIQTESTAVSKPKVLLLLLTARSQPPFLSKILRTFLTSKQNTISWIKASFTDTDGTCFSKIQLFLFSTMMEVNISISLRDIKMYNFFLSLELWQNAYIKTML